MTAQTATEEEAASAKEAQASSGFWTRIGARIVLMLGFAYAASWWSDQRFYSHFGIAPQNIGLTPSGGLSDIIGAIVRLGLWVALALIFLGFLPVLAVSAAGFAVEAPPEHGTGRRVVAVVIAVVAESTAFGVYGWLTEWLYAAIANAVAALAFAVWWFFSPAHKEDLAIHKPQATTPENHAASDVTPPPAPLAGSHKPDKPSWPTTFERFKEARTSWAVKVLDVFTIVAVVGLLLVDLPDDASQAASCVVSQTNRAVRGIGVPVGFIHLILLDVYAQPATITWIANKPTDPAQTSFAGVYLGTNNSTVIVYRPTTPSQLLRLPAGDVTVTINPNTAVCAQTR